MDVFVRRFSQNIEESARLGPAGRARAAWASALIVLALVAMYFGIDPSVVLQMAEGPPPSKPAGAPPANDPQARFVAKVLGETGRQPGAPSSRKASTAITCRPSWCCFAAPRPTCGTGQAAMGPFYCPGDSKVYIDLGFFDEMERRLNAPDGFAQAYVIAHGWGTTCSTCWACPTGRPPAPATQSGPGQRPVGAHGTAGRLLRQPVGATRRPGAQHPRIGRHRGRPECRQRHRRRHPAKEEPGHVVPDAFTHGSSVQRVRWFKRGLESGDLRQCDTFGAAQLARTASPRAREWLYAHTAIRSYPPLSCKITPLATAYAVACARHTWAPPHFRIQ